MITARAASAGTGKTTAIVQEVLRDIPHMPLRRIAVVSFTIAGSLDIRLRLEQALQQLLTTGEYMGLVLRDYEKPHYQQARLEVSGACISTIHGFFRRLLRLNAPALSLDPEFISQDDLESHLLFSDSAREVVTDSLLNPKSIGMQLLAHHGTDTVIEMLLHLHHKRSYSPFHASHPESKQLLELYELCALRTLERQAGRYLNPDDVEFWTLKLCNSPEMVKRVRERFHYLYVDEFQDVNPIQAKIFSTLGLAKTTLVGDAKQSIYAFRNADIDSFLNSFETAQKTTPLNYSYRHPPHLAEFLSSLATRLFPEYEELGLGNHVHSARKEPNYPTPVELRISKGKTLAEARQLEAHDVAARLSKMHGRYRWQDMVVLIRSRSSFKYLEQAFLAFGIPYFMQGQNFYTRPEIEALGVLLRLKNRPQLLDLASLSQLLVPPVHPPQEGDDVNSYVAAQPALAQALADIQNLPTEPYAFCMAVLERYPLEQLSKEAASNVQALLREIAQLGFNHVGQLERYLSLAAREKAADEPIGQHDAVSILTVHGAKGLEFPVVVLFDMAYDAPKLNALVHVSPEGEVATPNNPDFVPIQSRWQVRYRAEEKRLLYVACTRAKDFLMLTGSMAGEPRGWLEFLPVLHGLPHMRQVEISTMPVLPPQPLPESKRSADLGLAQAVLTVPDAVSRTASKSSTISDEAHSTSGWGKQIGTLVHDAIAQSLPLEHLSDLKYKTLLYSYSPEQVVDILARCGTLLANYYAMQDSIQREVDFAEVHFNFREGETTWHGIIDRLYCVEGTWILEDYKTDQPRDSLKEDYLPQLAVYFEAIRRTRGIEPVTRLCLLHNKSYVYFHTEELKDAWQTLIQPGSG